MFLSEQVPVNSRRISTLFRASLHLLSRVLILGNNSKPGASDAPQSQKHKASLKPHVSLISQNVTVPPRQPFKVPQNRIRAFSAQSPLLLPSPWHPSAPQRALARRSTNFHAIRPITTPILSHNDAFASHVGPCAKCESTSYMLLARCCFSSYGTLWTRRPSSQR